MLTQASSHAEAMAFSKPYLASLDTTEAQMGLKRVHLLRTNVALRNTFKGGYVCCAVGTQH